MNNYYEVTAINKETGEIDSLFGSFDKGDCVYELECEREQWKTDGYKTFKITVKQVNESPDPEVYGIGDSYKESVCKALNDSEVTISVGDTSENYTDLDDSRDLNDIFQAIEATDSPIIYFCKNGAYLGFMTVLVGYGDESISDCSYNEFMNHITDVIA